MIKLFYGLLAAAFIVIAGVSFAKAECQFKTAATFAEEVARAKEQGVTVREFTANEVMDVVSKLGNPPNAADGVPMRFVRADFDGNSALFILQGECVINMIGPVPSDLLNLKLGMTSAERIN